MALRIQSVNTVALGHFNRWIIRPRWLLKNRVVEIPEADEETASLRGGEGGALQFKLGDLVWVVTDHQVQIATDNITLNPTEPLKKLLKLLQHTPIIAVGVNFEFGCSIDEWQGPLPIDKGQARALEQSHDTIASSHEVHLRSRTDNHEPLIQLKVTQTTTNIVAYVNIHRERTESPAGTACDRWQSDLLLARVLLTTWLGEEIEL